MKINVKTPLVDLDGEPILNDKNEPTPVGSVLNIAANAPQPQGSSLTPEQSVDRMALMIEVHRGLKGVSAEEQTVDISNETASWLKREIARCYSPLVSAQVIKMLDGK